MEKTTKKKKSKRAKRRIGLIAVGGLSLVLTVCLSVGATLAWFAGSTWASNDLYMGGPVYVEMAGRGQAGLTSDNLDAGKAEWVGGDGRLDIIASARNTGTVAGNTNNNILLPGQKLLIYSQARVFSTLYRDTTNAGVYPNQSSGANTTNISNGTATYTDSRGTVQTATTSVLRAKFSINVEFDPSVGFNNFTDKNYANNYPKQSQAYAGDHGEDVDKLAWYEALYEDTENENEFDTIQTPFAYKKGTSELVYAADAEAQTNPVTKDATKGLYYHSKDTDKDFIIEKEGEDTTLAADVAYEVKFVKTYAGRRDSVNDSSFISGTFDETTNALNVATAAPVYDTDGTLKTAGTGLYAIKAGTKTSIFKWKFVSQKVYKEAYTASPGLCMGAPFDGTVNSSGGASNTLAPNHDTKPYGENTSGTGNGFYGMWVGSYNGSKYSYEESDAFYKARTEAYLKSYVEHYEDEYSRQLVLQIGDQLSDLEDALNNSFTGLVNESSDRILAGYVEGFTADDAGSVTYGTNEAASAFDDALEDGVIDSDEKTTKAVNATWLYVDPKIGNDINAGSASTSVGGWWYLVESDNATVQSGKNAITTVVDEVLTGEKDEAGAQSPDDVTRVATAKDVAEGKASYVGQIIYTWGNMTSASKNATTDSVVGKVTEKAWTRGATTNLTPESGKSATMANDDHRILHAKLKEVSPNITDVAVGNGATKVVSVSFPFVNGNFELPGKELTNIFANAKISFQITFQALQAFFPYTPSIDGIPAGSALAGTAKALNIENAIPIYNEAFDYLSFLSE